jgi:ferric-dicitrate binding protein FerR (iron transport regulator)
MEVQKRRADVSRDLKSAIAWRSGRLRAAGVSARLADAIARDIRYDAHALLELTDRGCPAELAARIIAPLNDEHQPRR